MSSLASMVRTLPTPVVLKRSQIASISQEPTELTRISGQITRLEDKLEDVLVAVERLEEQAERAENGARPRGRVSRSA